MMGKSRQCAPQLRPPSEGNIIAQSPDIGVFSTRCSLKCKAYTGYCITSKTISIFHGSMMWIEKPGMRVTDRHHEAFSVKEFLLNFKEVDATSDRRSVLYVKI